MKEEDGLAYIAMQFVNGPTLDDLMARAKPMKPDEIFRVLRQTAAALDFAHQKGIVHRDIKPANIMIDEDGSTKIADFGIAKAGASGSLTASGAILGTPNYMSPEQVQGTKIDGRSDQFSLAVVAYEILTGERPFAGEHLGTVVYKIVADQPADPHRLNPSLGPEITAVLRKGTRQAGRPPLRQLHRIRQRPRRSGLALRRVERPRPRRQPGASHCRRPLARRQTASPAAAPTPRSRPPEIRATSARKRRSLFLPALGAFLVVLGVLALLAWQTGSLQPPRRFHARRNTVTIAAAPPKVETSPAPDDTELQPPPALPHGRCPDPKIKPRRKTSPPIPLPLAQSRRRPSQ